MNSLLTTLLLVDAVEKGGPGSGPHPASVAADKATLFARKEKTMEAHNEAAYLHRVAARKTSEDSSLVAHHQQAAAAHDKASMKLLQSGAQAKPTAMPNYIKPGKGIDFKIRGGRSLRDFRRG
jgi:hypothetical protein